MPDNGNGAGAQGAQGAQGADGGGDPYAGIQYRTQLTQEIQADKTIMEALKETPKLTDLVKSHAQLKGRMARAIIVPNAENPDPVELKAFREAMGLPEKAEEYQFDTSAYKDVQGIEEVVAMARADAAEMSLTKVQAQKHLDSIMKLSKAGRDAMAKAAQEQEAAFAPGMLELNGKSPEKVAESTNMMKAAVLRMAQIAEGIRPGAGEGLVKRMAQSGLLQDPVFAMVSAQIQEYIGEIPFAQDGGRDRAARGGAKRGKMGTYSEAWQAQAGKKE